jgi:hypothetical protein
VQSSFTSTADNFPAFSTGNWFFDL